LLIHLKIRSRVVVLVLVATLSACATSTNAVFQSMQFAFRKDSKADDAKLNPDYRYLRVVIDGRVALLVLGYVDPHPAGPIEVWYSAESEIVRLQNGRIVGAVGLTTEWRSVQIPELPSWSLLVSSGAVTKWVRVRDVMPGYRFGLRDEMALQVVDPPSKTALRILDPQELTWFEERLEKTGETDDEHFLPPARYGVATTSGLETVVYGEQCLARQLCFSWQRWPAIGPSGISGK
jgi:hypothetical protein